MDHAQRPLFAILLRTAAVLLIATMFMLVKYAGQSGVAAPEIMFWRQAVTIPLILSWFYARGQLGRLRTTRMASHAARAAVGTTAMGLNFLATIILPLAEATTISFTTPLFAVLLTPLLLKERVGPWRWSSVVLGFIGVLIIAQPGAAPISPLGAAAGLAGGLAVALVSFQIRDLAMTEDPLACVFYFAVFGASMMALFLPAYVTEHDHLQWAILIAIGITGTFGQFLLTLSLKYGSVATVIIMDYTTLIWATLYGWLIWDHVPMLTTWLGAPAIIAAGIIITWRERRLSRSISPPSAQELGQGT